MMPVDSKTQGGCCFCTSHEQSIFSPYLSFHIHIVIVNVTYVYFCLRSTNDVMYNALQWFKCEWAIFSFGRRKIICVLPKNLSI